MLGASSYFTDVYLVYYGISVSQIQGGYQGFDSINPEFLNADNLMVL